MQADAPLKLLAPRGRNEASTVYASSYGGGLLAGDSIDLRFTAGAGTTGVLGTQASTKVYKSIGGEPSRQSVTGTIAEGAWVALLPDPLTCFAGAVFEQRQRIEVKAGGSLLLLDWLTSGRHAVGERWDFTRCRCRIDLIVENRLIFRDALLLDPQDGPIDVRRRMGRFNCLATLLLLGPRLREAAESMLRHVASQPVTPRPDLFFTAGPLADGAMVRVAGVRTEAVGDWLRERLGGVAAARDHWARKH